MIFFDCKVFNYFGELKRSVVRMQAIDACYTSRFLFDRTFTIHTLATVLLLLASTVASSF